MFKRGSSQTGFMTERITDKPTEPCSSWLLFSSLLLWLIYIPCYLRLTVSFHLLLSCRCLLTFIEPPLTLHPFNLFASDPTSFSLCYFASFSCCNFQHHFASNVDFCYSDNHSISVSIVTFTRYWVVIYPLLRLRNNIYEVTDTVLNVLGCCTTAENEWIHRSTDQ